MPKRSSKGCGPEDVDLLAGATVEQTTAGDQVVGGSKPGAVAFGRPGGKKSGPARAEKLTAEHRREIAKEALTVRWRTRLQR